MKQSHVLLLPSAARQQLKWAVVAAPLGFQRRALPLAARGRGCVVPLAAVTRHPRASCYIIAVKILDFRTVECSLGSGTVVLVTQILQSIWQRGGTSGVWERRPRAADGAARLHFRARLPGKSPAALDSAGRADATSKSSCFPNRERKTHLKCTDQDRRKG